MLNFVSKKNLRGKYINGKIIYVTPQYHFMKKTKFGGIGSTESKIYEFEIHNKELISNLVNEKWYRFNIIDGKAQII